MLLSDLINKNKRVLIIRSRPLHTWQSCKNRKNRRNTLQRTVPPTRLCVQSLSNHPYYAPLFPNKGQVAGNMAEGEGGNAGGFRAIFSGGEEGESSD